MKPNKVGRVILIRHGESVWNTTDPTRKMKTRFTGWADIPLSDLGMKQAAAAGRCLLQFKLHRFDAVFTSLLKRSTVTYDIISNEILKEQNICLNDIGFKNPTVVQSWRLNERHYGALIGLTKDEAVKKYGREKVRDWRLSWDIRPPDMSKHPFFYSVTGGDVAAPLAAGVPLGKPVFDWQSAIWTNPITKEVIPGRENEALITVEKYARIPLAESVKDCAERVLPLWEKNIVPRLLKGQTVLVVAHSNTIRGMVKYIDAQTLSDEHLKQVTIPSAMPMVYKFELDGTDSVKPIGRLSPLGVRGRFVVTPELIRLSLAASQHMEMSENLENSSAFQEELALALDKLRAQTRVHQLADEGTSDPINSMMESEDVHLQLLRNATRGDPLTEADLMEPGWMSLPVSIDTTGSESESGSTSNKIFEK